MSIITRLAIFLVFCSGLVIFYLNSYYGSNSKQIELNPKPATLEEYAIDTSGCKIPKLNPYHISLLSEIQDLSKKSLNCRKKRLIIAVNNTLLANRKARSNWKSVKCTYRSIIRKDEDTIDYGKKQELDLDKGSVVSDDFVMVECHERKFSFYKDYIPIITRKPDVDKRCDEILKTKRKNNQLSVLLLGIDSISKNSYLRHLQLVDKFIREKLTYIELHGYNKLGLNTYPNMIPFHTGKLETEYNINHQTEDLNVLPMLWKEFSKNGYRTLFAEDCPRVATFNYKKKGFKTQPTDYYMRPFAIAFQNSDVINKVPWGCFDDRPESTVMFEWVSNFFDRFPSDPLFAYIFLTRLTHDFYNAVAYHDRPVLKLLQELEKKGHLNRTMVIFLSDHGFRYGNVRTTYVGHLEEKLPFIFFLLPSWFPTVYPKFYENMKINEKRLVTPLDMHATLLDVISNFENVGGENWKDRSVSLFTPIADNRTCEIANINSQWCVCFSREQISPHDKSAQEGAQLLVNYVNNLLESVRTVCVELELEKVIEASAKNINIDDGQRFINYLILLVVQPSGAIFQGVVLYNNIKNEYTIEATVDRVNLYGNQSFCVQDFHLKPYCYCKDYSTSIDHVP